jgi:hypothetical protein
MKLKIWHKITYRVFRNMITPGGILKNVSTSDNISGMVPNPISVRRYK